MSRIRASVTSTAPYISGRRLFGDHGLSLCNRASEARYKPTGLRLSVFSAGVLLESGGVLRKKGPTIETGSGAGTVVITLHAILSVFCFTPAFVIASLYSRDLRSPPPGRLLNTLSLLPEQRSFSFPGPSFYNKHPASSYNRCAVDRRSKLYYERLAGHVFL